MLLYKTEILFVFKDLFLGHMIEYLSIIDKALGLYPEHIGKKKLDNFKYIWMKIFYLE